MGIRGILEFAADPAIEEILRPELLTQTLDPRTKIEVTEQDERTIVIVQTDTIVALRAVLNTILRMINVYQTTVEVLTDV